MGTSSDDGSDSDTSSDYRLIVESNSDSRSNNESEHVDNILATGINNDDSNDDDDSSKSNIYTSKGNQPPKKILKSAKDTNINELEEEGKDQEQLIQRDSVYDEKYIYQLTSEQLKEYKNSFDGEFIDIYNDIIKNRNNINQLINDCIDIQADIIIYKSKIQHLKNLIKFLNEKNNEIENSYSMND